jgi:hypothetical protein
VFPGGSRATGRRATEQEGGGGGGGEGGEHSRRDIVPSSPAERDTPPAALSHGASVSGTAAGACGETEEGREGGRVDERGAMAGAEISNSCNKRCKSAGAEGEAKEDFVGLLKVGLRDIYSYRYRYGYRYIYTHTHTHTQTHTHTHTHTHTSI